DEHHRLAVARPQVEQQLAHDGACLRIERAERLVHQQDLGIEDEDLRQADALALTAGELVRVSVQKGAQADAAQPIRSTLPGFGRRRAVHLERDGNVLQGRLPRHEGIGLEEIARLAVYAFELSAEDLALAGRWREQTRRYVQQCGFATSRRTD